jgi:cell wall-associated NlpC family hydrolase
LPAGFTLPAGTPVQVVKALTYALQQLGKPYLWGGTGPDGYDCSGLVMEAYLAAGVSLPRTTYQQVNAGTPVYAASQLRPGDLVFTAGSDGTDTNPGHVGIYLGNDIVEDAPHTGADIELSKFDGGYWNKSAVAFRRIVG